MVIALDNAPSVLVMTGDVVANSCGDRPLAISVIYNACSYSPTPNNDLNIDVASLISCLAAGQVRIAFSN